MAAEIEEAVTTIRHQAYKEAYRLYTEEQRTPLLSMMQRREILARIARGEVKVCRYVKNGDRYIMLFEDPRPRDMMQAMQIDAKFEEACNRMRNFNDPVLSQFNIYIDGRPCDDPAAPVNTDLPPGIVMLPRKAKKMLQEPPAPGSVELSPAAALSPAGGGVTLVTGVGHSRGTHNTGLDPVSPDSPLYPRYLNILEKRKLAEEDILHATWYSQHKRAEAEAPPPHIYTDEEIAEMDRTLAEERSRTLGQPQYNTFGKMYFPEKDTRCNL